jgi:hypothetical protein
MLRHKRLLRARMFALRSSHVCHLLAGWEHLQQLLLAAPEQEGVHGGTLRQALTVCLVAAANQVHQGVVLGGHILNSSNSHSTECEEAS